MKQAKRMVESCVIVPPQNPGDKIWITGIRRSIPQVSHVGSGQHRREEAERENDQQLTDERPVHEPNEHTCRAFSRLRRPDFLLAILGKTSCHLSLRMLGLALFLVPA